MFFSSLSNQITYQWRFIDAMGTIRFILGSGTFGDESQNVITACPEYEGVGDDECQKR
jgi:hypothetical protein